MPTTNLSFAKIVATPTSSSWSQAYNAGSLFIVLALTTDDEELQKELPTHGKQLLSNLEAEFFGLEDKNFETIKKAITSSLPEMPEAITISLALAFSKEDTLFAFILGSGRITLKRSDKIGVILENLESNRELHSSSGYLESNDLILIQTGAFAGSVPHKTIVEALENSLPNDIAEIISPSVHGGTEGGASAIILSYKGISAHPLEEEPEQAEATPQPSSEPIKHTQPIIHESAYTHDTSSMPDKAFSDDTDDENGPSFISNLTARLPKLSLPGVKLDRQKRIVLAATCILLGLLIVSIIFVQKNSQSSKNHALFEEIYTSAKKDYDEAEGLLSLNKSLARDDYQSARQTLYTASGKFKPGSDEANKIKELSDLVDKRLAEFGGSSQANLKEADTASSPVLAALTKDAVLAATSEDSTVYTITSKEVAKDGSSTIKNDSNWSNVKALGVFSGNVYVLDTKALIKFIPAGSDYAESSYFKGDAPSLSNVKSMAIDSSIYLLFADGSIQKYTRGTKDNFSINGLTKSLANPVSIYTSPDVENIYVLDPSNSRLVKLDKSGTFIKEYAANQLSGAKALTVSKDEKTAAILIGTKVYELSL